MSYWQRTPPYLFFRPKWRLMCNVGDYGDSPIFEWVYCSRRFNLENWRRAL